MSAICNIHSLTTIYGTVADKPSLEFEGASELFPELQFTLVDHRHSQHGVYLPINPLSDDTPLIRKNQNLRITGYAEYSEDTGAYDIELLDFTVL